MFLRLISLAAVVWSITTSLGEDISDIKSKEENVSDVLKMYVDRFNADDEEHHLNEIPSSKALDFFLS